MKGSYLGEFEELVLLTVGSLYKEAYGVAIMDEIESQTERSVNVSAVHAALKRLESKGFVNSHMGGATNERGGRRKRYFELTVSGKKVLDESMALRTQLYNRIPNISYSFSYYLKSDLARGSFLFSKAVDSSFLSKWLMGSM